MSDRDLIVVDVETTGLNVGLHVPIEVAAINTRTGEQRNFFPRLSADALAVAAPEALAVNRYFERRCFEHALDADETVAAYGDLLEFLAGATLGGANVRFDAAMLMAGVRAARYPSFIVDVNYEPWHFRLADLESAAAGALGLPMTELPSLARCCELLGVKNIDPHTALGDATATAACFARIAELPKPEPKAKP